MRLDFARDTLLPDAPDLDAATVVAAQAQQRRPAVRSMTRLRLAYLETGRRRMMFGRCTLYGVWPAVRSHSSWAHPETSNVDEGSNATECTRSWCARRTAIGSGVRPSELIC